MEHGDKKCPQCAEEVKAEANVCRFCGHRFDGAAAVSAAVRKRPAFRTIGCLATAGLAILVVTCTAKLGEPGSRLASSSLGVDTQLQKIKLKVADDAVKQYDIAKKGGSSMDRCVQAGFVAAAYLQAQKSAEYDVWKATEKLDCTAAGVGR